MFLLHFLFVDHEPGLFVLAAIVCMVSAYACIGLLRHAHKATGRMRWLWLGVSAATVGFGIWSTHFVAVLAFRAGFTLDYDLWQTLGSLLIAISVCGAGTAMAVAGSTRRDHFLGGAVVGIGISTMHYTGIAALIMGGRIEWQPGLVALSILAGLALAGLSFVVAMGQGRRRVLYAAGMLASAICAMHFTAMGAADFSRCFPLSANAGINGFWLSIAIAGLSVLVVGAAIGSMILDEADRRRTAREMARQLRDAAQISEVSQRLELAMTHMAQGLSLYDADGRLVLYNTRLPLMLGIDPTLDLHGLSSAMSAASPLPATSICPQSSNRSPTRSRRCIAR